MKLKALKEKRNDLLIEATKLLDKAEEEVRSLSDDEKNKYEELYKEIERLSDTIKKIEEKQEIKPDDDIKDDNEENKSEEEVRSFEKFCRGETRALQLGNNGGIVPRSVTEKIITAVKENCPIMELATVYNVKGDLIIPIYDEASEATADYIDEFNEITEKTGELKSINLTSHIVSVLSLVSNKLINNTDFDIVSFIISEAAKNIAEFIEKETLVGDRGKIKGMFPNVNKVVTAKDATITTDDIISLQLKVPTKLQANAVWIMHPSTFDAVLKLKDANGQHLLMPNMVTGAVDTILGKKVYLSENAPKYEAGARAIIYGDITGYTLKLSTAVEMKVLTERYADKYAVGVIGYTEVDGCVTEQSKLAVLELGA